MTATETLLVQWPAALVLGPLLAAVAAFAWPRAGAAVGLATSAASLAGALALAAAILAAGPVQVVPGGWAAPLGIALHADGLAALMIAMTAGVGSAVALAATHTPGARQGQHEDEGHDPDQGVAFWPLWLLLLAGLNGLYLSADAFNLYITLEIVGLAAVGLTALSGTPESVRAALTYLLAGLMGSLLFLLGVALLYAAYGRVDFAGLATATAAGPAMSAALVAMLVGLALKTAIVPLHVWLPAAHANATPPASALLSALVIKGSLYAAIRLWLTVFEPAAALGTLMGLLGAGAILWGSVQALRAPRLKLVVAYSTIAQVGLILVAFAVAGDDAAAVAWRGAVCLMLAHAVAKAAMFLAVGRIVALAGTDDLARLGRARVRPGPAMFAFALAAVSLIGLPPSGGFTGKWLLLAGSIAAGAWPWAAAIAAATLLSAAYMTRVLARFLDTEDVPADTIVRPGWARADAVPLALAVAAAGLGLAAGGPLALLAAEAPAVARVGDPM